MVIKRPKSNPIQWASIYNMGMSCNNSMHSLRVCPTDWTEKVDDWLDRFNGVASSILQAFTASLFANLCILKTLGRICLLFVIVSSIPLTLKWSIAIFGRNQSKILQYIHLCVSPRSMNNIILVLVWDFIILRMSKGTVSRSQTLTLTPSPFIIPSFDLTTTSIAPHQPTKTLALFSQSKPKLP